MGQLVMSFLGICLHVRKEAGLPPGVGHRVVAVDASQPGKDVWKGHIVPPHYCYLDASEPVGKALEDAGIGLFEHLKGWRMSVANALPLRVDLTVPPVPPSRDARPQGGNLDGVPRLENYSAGMKLRPDLLRDGAPEKAAFFVDISAGIIVAEAFPQGGVYSTWMVETDGDPELLFTRRKGKSLTVTIPSTPPGAHFPPNFWFGAIPGSLALHNSTFDTEDKQYDFVLHYLARDGGIPTDLRQPFPGEDNDVIARYIGTSTSCSNSQYP
jgi:hypothetical protein